MRESERKGRRAGGGGGMYSMCEIDRLMGRGRRRRERERNFMRGLCSAAAAEKRPSQGQDGCQMRVH